MESQAKTEFKLKKQASTGNKVNEEKNQALSQDQATAGFKRTRTMKDIEQESS